MFESLVQQPLGPDPLDFSGISFHPVMHLPAEVAVFDFSKSYDPNRTLAQPYGIGRYNEVRPTMYTEAQFADHQRNIHMGIDLAAPVGTRVHAFYEGRIHAFGLNPLPQDYGPTIITAHTFGTETLYALYGHLSSASLTNLKVGAKIGAGTCLGTIGTPEENGGWNPHLHFQLSRVRPSGHDLPGAVSRAYHDWALRAFPDPRIVLGPIYV